MADEEEPFRAHNWKQLTPQQLRNLPAVQRGKYLAYEEPPKDVLDAQEATLKRIRETYKQKKMATKGKEPIDLGKFLYFSLCSHPADMRFLLVFGKVEVVLKNKQRYLLIFNTYFSTFFLVLCLLPVCMFLVLDFFKLYATTKNSPR